MDTNSDVKITLVDENGKVTKNNILFTFNCEELNKDYIVFETDLVDADGKHIIGATAYNPNDTMVKINPITDPDELAMIEDAFNTVLESQGE